MVSYELRIIAKMDLLWIAARHFAMDERSWQGKRIDSNLINLTSMTSLYP